MEDEEYFDVDFIERDPNNMNEFLLVIKCLFYFNFLFINQYFYSIH